MSASCRSPRFVAARALAAAPELGRSGRSSAATLGALGVAARRGRRVRVAARRSTRIEERNMFYVAPLFLIALLLWIAARRAAAARRRTPSSPSAAALLVAPLPFARSSAFRRLPTRSRCCRGGDLQEHVIDLDQVRLVATLCALGAAALFLLVPSATRSRCRCSSSSISRSRSGRSRPARRPRSRGALFQGIRSAPPRLDRPRASASAPTSRRSGPANDRRARHLGERVLQPQRRHRSTTSAAAPIPRRPRSTARRRSADDGYLRDAHGRRVRAPLRARRRLARPERRQTSPPTSAIGINLWELDRPVRSLTQVPASTRRHVVRVRRLVLAGSGAAAARCA